ncbi:Methyltransferase type 11 [Thiomonas delicata]|uniref:Methyltransferase type 11 n=2 Tax=Thiomonas delicata TaxID=364030 RepID=A0A238D5U4_THIDL|nr:Methyltransferase type 11 [Thiomonas delicata]
MTTRMKEANKQSVNRRAAGYWHFMREFVRNPRQIGAICPSSPFLARRMASLVPQGDGVVLELGPGAGAVTAALLNQGVAAQDLVLVERSAALSALLAKRFPGVQLIQGDAMHLSRFDVLRQQPVRAIVSSLPLRSLPRPVVRQILDQVALISDPGTVFIQFSYALRGSYQNLAHGFERDQAHVVWRNLPPARIEAFCFRPRQVQ